MRRHPTRGMYDQLEDTLMSITMQLRSAIEADANRPPQVNGAGGPLQRASGWARQMSAELGSVLLDALGLEATIEWHVRQFQKSTGVRCGLAVNNTAGFNLPENYAKTIFEIYNEALSNVARHARASRVAIALTITPEDVTMVVRDDGIGLANEAAASGARGLAAIRTRSRVYQGSCEVFGEKHAGTTVTLRLPIA